MPAKEISKEFRQEIFATMLHNYEKMSENEYELALDAFDLANTDMDNIKISEPALAKLVDGNIGRMATTCKSTHFCNAVPSNWPADYVFRYHVITIGRDTENNLAPIMVYSLYSKQMNGVWRELLTKWSYTDIQHYKKIGGE